VPRGFSLLALQLAHAQFPYAFPCSSRCSLTYTCSARSPTRCRAPTTPRAVLNVVPRVVTSGVKLDRTIPSVSRVSFVLLRVPAELHALHDEQPGPAEPRALPHALHQPPRPRRLTCAMPAPFKLNVLVNVGFARRCCVRLPTRTRSFTRCTLSSCSGERARAARGRAHRGGGGGEKRESEGERETETER
jgi:hypothetical protein